MSASEYAMSQMNLPPIVTIDGGDQQTSEEAVVPPPGQENNDGKGETDGGIDDQAAAGTPGDGSSEAGSAESGEDAGLHSARSDDSAHGKQPAGEPAPAEPERGPDLAQLKEQAARYAEFEAAYGRDPQAFMRNLMGGLTPQQRAQLAQEAGLAPAPEQAAQQAAGQFRDDAELTAEELYVKRAVAPIVQELPRYAQQVNDTFGQHAGALNDLMYRNAVLEQQVAALMEANDLALPAADRKEVETAVRQGKSFEDAVKTIYAPKAKQVVAVKKAQAKPVPTTPKNGAGENTTELPRNATFYQIFKAAERELAAKHSQ